VCYENKNVARQGRRATEDGGLSAMQDGLQESNRLTQADKADHGRDDHGENGDDFIQHTADHVSSDDGAQNRSSFHGTTSFQKKIRKNL